jgi:hypothetical protein
MDKPKKNLTAYFYFCKEKKCHIKLAAQLWAEIKEDPFRRDELEQYNKIAKADSERYHKEIAVYNAIKKEEKEKNKVILREQAKLVRQKEKQEAKLNEIKRQIESQYSQLVKPKKDNFSNRESHISSHSDEEDEKPIKYSYQHSSNDTEERESKHRSNYVDSDDEKIPRHKVTDIQLPKYPRELESRSSERKTNSGKIDLHSILKKAQIKQAKNAEENSSDDESIFRKRR